MLHCCDVDCCQTATAGDCGTPAGWSSDSYDPDKTHLQLSTVKYFLGHCCHREQLQTDEGKHKNVATILFMQITQF